MAAEASSTSGVAALSLLKHCCTLALARYGAIGSLDVGTEKLIRVARIGEDSSFMARFGGFNFLACFFPECCAAKEHHAR